MDTHSLHTNFTFETVKYSSLHAFSNYNLKNVPVMKLISAPFKEMVQPPQAIFLHGFEEHIKVSIGCCEYDYPGFDEAKHCVNKSVQVMRQHVLYHLYCDHCITSNEPVVWVCCIAFKQLKNEIASQYLHQSTTRATYFRSRKRI